MATKKRLIDAIFALKRLETNCTAKESTKLWIRRHIETCPTVDAVEVVHGRWIKWYPPAHMIMTGEEMLYRCSSCDAKYPDAEGYRYCPHCGAMMDGAMEEKSRAFMADDEEIITPARARKEGFPDAQ